MGEKAKKHFKNRFSQGFEIRFSETIEHVYEQNHRNMNLTNVMRSVFSELIGKENVDAELFGNKKLKQKTTREPRNFRGM
ncbi:MAG: hypothetical protein RBU23_05100 [Candidatus Auribacterota bacterium]|jgi:hypothetical protein|nr:hypothetical protein [Candidatus Auribacterota bacterium]